VSAGSPRVRRCSKPGTLRLGTPVSASEADADLVVAADDIHSGARRALLPGHPGTVYTGVTSWRVLVSGFTGEVQPMEVWGKGCVFGVAPLADGRVYCYATAVAPADVKGRSPC
jgi:2-polyprenyl-6-methoxyphenol hydroxylase-like FAD-dependent oxidoreductase